MAYDIRPAAPDDIPLILEFIRGLAEYEKMLDQVAATPDGLRASLFPADGGPGGPLRDRLDRRRARRLRLLLLQLLDLAGPPGPLPGGPVRAPPRTAGKGIGKALLVHLAGIALRENGAAASCGRCSTGTSRRSAFYESLGARRLREWQLCRLAGADLEKFGRV